MPRQIQELTLFVASPSDVGDERASLEEIIIELNQHWSRFLNIRIDLVRWETNSYPGFGEDGQDVINRQLPDDYDIFVGIMWGRFGTATKRANSGTEEEFNRAKARWDRDNTSVNLMIYFKDQPIQPSQIDLIQLSKVHAFRKSLPTDGGLYWTFNSNEDFRTIIRAHLTRVVQEWMQKQNLTIPNVGSTTSETCDETIDLEELIEEFTDCFALATNVMNCIVEASEQIWKKIAQHTANLSLADETMEMAEAKFRENMSAGAVDINDYANSLRTYTPELDRLLSKGLAAISRAIPLWPEMLHSSEFLIEAKSNIIAIRTLRDQVSQIEGNVRSFQSTVLKTPKVNKDLSDASRLLAIELQKLIKFSQSQQQILLQIEMAGEEIISEKIL